MIDNEQKELMEKMVSIILNKEDILDDAEVVSEYKKQFLDHALTYLSQKFGIKIDKDEIPVFVMSTVTRTGVDTWLDAIQHYLQYEREHSALLLFDVVPVPPKPVGHIRDVTAEALPMLVEKSYLDPLDAKYAKVWEVEDAEFCRLAYMLPWGNDEAELWFWNVMNKKRFVAKLETAGLVKGDIVKIKSLYNGVQDRYIKY